MSRLCARCSRRLTHANIRMVGGFDGEWICRTCAGRIAGKPPGKSSAPDAKSTVQPHMDPDVAFNPAFNAMFNAALAADPHPQDPKKRSGN